MNVHPKISIVIRSKNEEKTIGKVLEEISNQSVKPDEIILADNKSTDKTISIARRHSCRVLNIDNPFNHARSCNLALAACKSDFVVLMNGHSFPTRKDWLISGLAHFKNSTVAGVFGNHYCDDRASIWEIIEKKKSKYNKSSTYVYSIVGLNTGGLMNTVCCMLRKKLWKEYNFNEEISSNFGGGEDTDWGFHFIRLGYQIIQEPKFSVYHCHGGNLGKFLRRQYGYSKMWLGVFSRNRE